MKTYYEVEDLTRLLEVSAGTIYKWIRSGELPASLTNKKSGYRVLETDLKLFLNKHADLASTFYKKITTKTSAKDIASLIVFGPAYVPFILSKKIKSDTDKSKSSSFKLSDEMIQSINSRISESQQIIDSNNKTIEMLLDEIHTLREKIEVLRNTNETENKKIEDYNNMLLHPEIISSQMESDQDK